MDLRRVAIVLGHEMDETGWVGIETAARVDLACEDVEGFGPELLILNGWGYRENTKCTLAESMHSYIEKRYKGLRTRIVCQNYSRDTVGDAFFSHKYIEKLVDIRGLEIRLYTSEYHCCRAVEIFKLFFGNTETKITARGVRGFCTEEKAKKERRSLRQFFETFEGVKNGDVEKAECRLKERHPLYNGRVYAFPCVELK